MNKSYQWITAAIITATLTPLMLVHMEMWDGTIYEMGYRLNDLSYLDPSLWMGKYITVYLWHGIHELSLLTGLPHKAFTNVITFISILGIARAAYRYLIAQFDLSKEAACIASWFVIAFPAWHVFISGANSDYVMYFWLFMEAVNLRHRHPVMATVLLIISLQFYSLFAFAIGFAGAEFFMTVKKTNYKQKFLKAFLFCAVLLAGFIVLQNLINIHGARGGDNNFKLDRLQSFVNYFIMAASLLSAWLIAKFKWLTEEQSDRAIRLLLSFLSLALFAGLAYWAIGRPMRFFAFGSYTARHTILCSIPMALAIGAFADYAIKAGHKKLLQYTTSLCITAFIVVLYQGYDHKVAALVFKDMLIESLQNVPEPESGFVSIAAKGYQAPRHFHTIDTNSAFYRAYGKAAWGGNGFWAKRGHIYDKKELKEFYRPNLETEPKWQLIMDLKGDAFTRYDFIVENYHQEGRFWYWYNYLTKDYDYFKARLVKL